MASLLARRRFIVSGLILLVFSLHLANPQTAATQKENTASLEKFTGTWEAKCQDDRTFVIVSFHASGNHLTGSVSIANMHGDNEGACMLVLAPPSPEHAQPVTEAVAKNDTLSFAGTKRPDGTAAQFEFTKKDSSHAELKLLNTPVADHPWLLEKTQYAQ